MPFLEAESSKSHAPGCEKVIACPSSSGDPLGSDTPRATSVFASRFVRCCLKHRLLQTAGGIKSSVTVWTRNGCHFFAAAQTAVLTLEYARCRVVLLRCITTSLVGRNTILASWEALPSFRPSSVTGCWLEPLNPLVHLFAVNLSDHHGRGRVSTGLPSAAGKNPPFRSLLLAKSSSAWLGPTSDVSPWLCQAPLVVVFSMVAMHHPCGQK